MEDFNMVFEKMNMSYRSLEAMMGDIYQQLKTCPENMQLQGLLQQLGDIANNILKSQIQFTETYCSSDIKNVILNRLYEKQTYLLNALAIDKAKVM